MVAKWLVKLGFGASRKLRSGGYKVGCTQCEPLVINGVPCHETGCPNLKRAKQMDMEMDMEGEQYND